MSSESECEEECDGRLCGGRRASVSRRAHRAKTVLMHANALNLGPTRARTLRSQRLTMYTSLLLQSLVWCLSTNAAAVGRASKRATQKLLDTCLGRLGPTEKLILSS